MDIIFQSGEFWNEPNTIWSNLLGGLLGAIISAGIALYVFNRGLRNEKRKLDIEYRQLGKQIRDFLGNSIINYSDQYSSFQDYLARLKQYPYQHNNLNITLNPLAKTLRNYDHVLLHKIFKSLKIETTNHIDLINFLVFLDDVTEKIRSEYERKSTKFITPLSNRFIKVREEILESGFDYINEHVRNGTSDEPLTEYLSSFVVYYYQETSGKYPDIKYDMNYAIKPLESELTSNFKNHIFTSQTLKKTRKAKNLFTSVKQSSNTLGIEISNYLPLYHDTINRLKSIKVELDKIYSA